MDLLIDTNVIINYITMREDPFRESSRRVMELCALRKLNGFVAFHSLPVIWYVMRKTLSDSETCAWLRVICRILTIVSATQEQVQDAIERGNFRDFEDCLQDKCAQNAGADYLVTCNIKDFRNAETRAVTPDELLKILESRC